MKFFLATFVLLVSFQTSAEVSGNAKQEISHLFSHLKSSGCEFNRNGSWYTADAAVTHLNNKYEYLLGKNLITTTEDFIDRAASQSTMSHIAYIVKCGDKETKSAVWFNEELTKFRISSSK